MSWKEKVKVSLFIDDVIVYISDPPPKKIYRRTTANNFSKVAGYKINSNKSVGFLYTKDTWVEKELMETTPFTIVTNSIK